MIWSRLCHPLARAFGESDGHGFTAIVILHGDDGSGGRARFRIALQTHAIVKFQRQGGDEDGDIGSREFQDGSLAQLRVATSESGYLHRNSSGSYAREEFGQLFRAAAFDFRQCQTR